MMVRAGDTLSFVLSGAYGGWLTPRAADSAGELRTGVLQRFRDETTLTVVSLRIESGGSIGSYLSSRFPYNAQITVAARMAYGSRDDVAAVVKGVFWRASDEEPLFDAVTLPALPGLGPLNLSLGLIAVIVLTGAAVWFKR